MSDLTVLITGGAGFIGCEISQRLALLGHRVVVLDNLHPQVHITRARPGRLHPDVELIVGDVAIAEDFDRVLSVARPDTVLHLAAETGTGQSLLEATRHGIVNVVGTTQLCDALARHEVTPSRVILSGSRAVYGEGAWSTPDGEIFYPGQRTHAQLQAGRWDFPDAKPVPSSADRTQPQPTSVYGATKLAQENILSAWCLAVGVALSVLRFQNVYGPGQSLSNPYTGIVSLFSRLARNGQRIALYEDGLPSRDFVYIDDVVSAVVAEVCVTEPGLRRLDIGSGEVTTLSRLADVLVRFYDSPEPVVTGQFRDGDIRHASCRIDATLRALDWRPEWSIERGLAALQDWIGAVDG